SGGIGLDYNEFLRRTARKEEDSASRKASDEILKRIRREKDQARISDLINTGAALSEDDYDFLQKEFYDAEINRLGIDKRLMTDDLDQEITSSVNQKIDGLREKAKQEQLERQALMSQKEDD